MKRSYAFFTCVCGLASAALIAASLGTETWSLILITRNTSAPIPCRLERTLGLFNGKDVDGCNVLVDDVEISYSTLSSQDILSIEVGLYYAVIAISALAIFFGLLAAAVAGYNLCSRPFETWAGPVGLLSYFSCGLILNFVAVILFLVTGFVDLNDTVPNNCADQSVYGVCKEEAYEQVNWEFGYSFYILISGLASFILGIIMVLIAGKSLKNKIKNKLCPGAIEESVVMEKGGNTSMMF